MSSHESPDINPEDSPDISPESLDAELAELLQVNGATWEFTDGADQDLLEARAEVLSVLEKHGLVPDGVDMARLVIDEEYETEMFVSGTLAQTEFLVSFTTIVNQLSLNAKEHGIEPEAIGGLLHSLETHEWDAWLEALTELCGQLPLSMDPCQRADQLEMLVDIHAEKRRIKRESSSSGANYKFKLEELLVKEYGKHDSTVGVAHGIMYEAKKRKLHGTSVFYEDLKLVASQMGIGDEELEQLIQDAEKHIVGPADIARLMLEGQDDESED